MATTTKDSATSKTTSSEAKTTTAGISPEVIKEMSQDINSMLAYASRNAIQIDTNLLGLIENSSVNDLINAHNLLVKNVAPASPKSILYTRKLYQEDQNVSLLRKLPLVRNLIILALIFMALFIGTALFPEVNNDSLDKGVLENNGLNLLLNLGFLCSISGLGVTFYLLKTVSTSLKKGRLIPEDTIYYIALIVLGVMAGIILSEIIQVPASGSDDVSLFNKSVLALLGGFSSDAIFSVLQSIIERLKNLFSLTPTD